MEYEQVKLGAKFGIWLDRPYGKYTVARAVEVKKTGKVVGYKMSGVPVFTSKNLLVAEEALKRAEKEQARKDAEILSATTCQSACEVSSELNDDDDASITIEEIEDDLFEED